MKQTLAILSLALLMIAPMAAAHAAPDPRSFETRALHDYNDDSVVVLGGQYGFDTIALDVRELRFPDGTEALGFKLSLNGGCGDAAPDCPELTELVQFSVDGTAQEILFSSTDGGASFGGSAPFYVQPYSLNDGSRFAVEAWVPYADLAVVEGSVLSDFFVEGSSGNGFGDNMPEGIGPLPEPAVPGVLDGLAFDIGDYTVGSSSKYLDASAGVASLELVPGGSEAVTVTLTSTTTEGQNITLLVDADDGITASVAEAPGPIEMAGGFAQEFELSVGADDGADGFVTFTATSDVGGFAQYRLPVSVPTQTVDESLLTSPDLLTGESWSHTFQTAGIFSYHNHHAPAIGGTITIEGHDDHAMDANGPMDGMDDMDGMDAMPLEATTHDVVFDGAGFEPHELTIQKGDTVTFINNAEDMLMIMGGVSPDGSGGHEHHDHDHEDEDGGFLGIPMVPVPLILVGIAAAALLARRR